MTNNSAISPSPLLRQNVAALESGEYVFSVRAKLASVSPTTTFSLDIGDRKTQTFTGTSTWTQYTVSVSVADFPL